MEKIEIKYKSLCKAFDTLTRAVEHFEKVKANSSKNVDYYEYEDLYQSARDSLIQRFEFTIDLFWKYLKLYMLDVKGLSTESNTPKDVIRSACKSQLISEDDTHSFISMIKSRNLTSHIYKEEISDQISKEIIKYYKILEKNIKRLH